MKWLKKRMSLTLLLLLVFSLGGCSSEYAKSEDIKLTPARWSADGSFWGIEYSEDEGGVLLTNTSTSHAKVEVIAKFYDDDRNYIDEDSKSLTLRANGSWFVFFDKDDDVAKIEYSVTTDEPFWDVVSLDDIEIEYEDEKVIVKNKSKTGTEACSIQFVYYKNGKIVDVVTGTVNDGYVPANEKVAEEISFDTSVRYDEYKVNIYCLHEK